jgi:hypothetical protein
MTNENPRSQNPMAEILDQIDARKANVAALEAKLRKQRDERLAAMKAKEEEDRTNLQQTLISGLGREPTEAETADAQREINLHNIQYGSLLPYVSRDQRADVEPSVSVSRGNKETAAIQHLAPMLCANPEMKRSEAVAYCTENGVSLRGALLRVWPRARESAGLSPLAPGGRKPKSTRA